MKYIAFSYNDSDKEWAFYGSFDSYDEAVARIRREDKQAKFTLRNENSDLLRGVYSDWSGNDQYFIMPAIDQS